MKTPSLGAVRLKAWRETKGLTQRQAGDLIGLDMMQVSKLERGVGRPSLENAHRIEAVTAIASGDWLKAAVDEALPGSAG